jgi:hypothetical protein
MKTLSELKACLIFAAACAVIGLSGCGGGGPQVCEVSGTITYAGVPLPNVAITFEPVDGSRSSYGESDAEGHFTMRYSGTEDGALAGEHLVFVEYLPQGEEGMAYMEGRLQLKGTIKEVMDKYGSRETSPYRVTIEDDVDDLEIKLE